MSRKHDEATASRHIEVYETDWEFLQKHFGRQSEAKVGVSVAIRQMIRKGVRDYQERLARRLDRIAQAKPPQGGQGGQGGQSLDKFFATNATDLEGSETNDL